MNLSPDEKRKIYEEEKERIEAEEKQRMTEGGSTSGMEPNIAGLLCYLGFWITGIVFLIIEQKNTYVRFHALQSIVTFGALTVVSIFLSWIPVVGSFFSAIISIVAIVLWILLMVKAYQGELYKIPVAGEVAGGILPMTSRHEKSGEEEKPGTAKAASSDEVGESTESTEVPSPAVSEKNEESSKRIKDDFALTRNRRIAGYGAIIFWNVIVLIFFSFFYRYISWYHVEQDGSLTAFPLLTNEYFMWLPILVTALVISITAQIVLIIHDRYWLKEIIQIILTVIDVIVVANLLTIFPFDFSVVPDATAAAFLPVAVTIFLIIIAVGLGVWALVRFIKLIIDVTK